MTAANRLIALCVAGAMMAVPWSPARADAAPLPEAGRLVAPAAAGSANLVVATFNVRNANWSSQRPTNSREKSWDQRRPVVVSQILGEGVDVLGVQETTAADVTANGPQYLDLLAALGEPYAITSESRYDGGEYCYTDYVEDVDGNYVQNPDGSYVEQQICEWEPEASGDVRIVYKKSRLVLDAPRTDQGVLKLDDRDNRNGSARFMAWARFRDLVTGKRFIFATGHVEPGMTKPTIALRRSQAQLIVAELNRLNPENLPIIWGSDLASSKLSPSGNTAYDVFRSAGFTDPLGNSYKVKKKNKLTYAKKLVNAQYFTLNNFKAQPDKNKRYKLGAHLDYILIKTPGKKATVAQWKQVLYLDKLGKFSGVIPSDHNLVAVTLALP